MSDGLRRRDAAGCDLARLRGIGYLASADEIGVDHRTLMAAFWRRSRRVCVPLTRGELIATMPVEVDSDAAIKAMHAEGLIVGGKERGAGSDVTIYEVTPHGATIAQRAAGCAQ